MTTANERRRIAVAERARMVGAVNQISKHLEIPGAETPQASWNLMALARLVERLETVEAYILQQMELKKTEGQALINQQYQALKPTPADPPTQGLE